jgi:hypothetical protein
MANKHLAWEVKADPTMLQAPLHHTAPKNGTLATTRLSQLIATAAAKAILVSITLTAIATAYSSQLAPHTAVGIHACLQSRPWTDYHLE